MTTSGDFDRHAAAWLADGPAKLDDRVLKAALREVRLTRQRRALRAPWRLPNMTLLTRTTGVAAVVLVAVVAAGGILYVSSRGPGGRPTDTPAPTAMATPSAAAPSTRPTAAPTINLDPSTWVGFTSTRYGYSIKVPSGWTATQGSRDWTMEADRTNWLSPAQDRFIDATATYQIGVHGFAVDIPTGTSGDAWIDAYFEGTTAASGCLAAAVDLPAITVDGHPGKLADQPACDDTIAFVLIGKRMHVFTIGRANQLPLFEVFLSTVRFSP